MPPIPQTGFACLLLMLAAITHGADAKSKALTLPAGSTAKVVLLTGTQLRSDGTETNKVLIQVIEVTAVGDAPRRVDMRAVGTAIAQTNSDRVKITTTEASAVIDNGQSLTIPFSGWLVNNIDGKPGAIAAPDKVDRERMIKEIQPTISLTNGQAATLILDTATELPLAAILPPNPDNSGR